MGRWLGLAVLIATWLLLTVAPASAQYFGRNKVQYDDFDFSVLSTEHFDVHFYDSEEQAVRDAARMSERWYDRHSVFFSRTFKEKKPLIFYANDADFQQTNVIQGFISQGTGGVTESLKERVVMPLTGLYAETNHVLGHELVHSFQYDIALNDTTRFNLRNFPLWMIEGTAEYLSVGREDPHTAMWLRDAVLRDDLPTMEQLTREPQNYFPYRYGQAYMAYLGGKYGDASVTQLYKRGGLIGVDSAFVEVFGITADSLSQEWIAAVQQTYQPLIDGRTAPDSVGRNLLNEETTGGAINVSPAISPDGRYIAFLSERDLFYINLFIADAETGEIVQELDRIGTGGHFDSIRFLYSAGTWSPDGTKFAFVTFAEGDNELAILDIESGDVERRIAVDEIGSIHHPAWSPDGRSIAFSGTQGGVSDLYLLDLDSETIHQLTDDRYGDLTPAWSPDGRVLAFATDRGPGGTDFETLEFAQPRLGLIDIETGELDVRAPFGEAQHFNPQFSPDGRNLYFISTRAGYKDLYRLNLATNRTYQVTELATGVSGIAGMSPALSVASQSGRLAFSVFDGGDYSIATLGSEEARGTRLDAPRTSQRVAGTLPPVASRQATAGLVASYLDDPLLGLPEDPDYPVEDYSPRLTLDYVAPPSFGAQIGGPYGTGLTGGVAFLFSDMLNNHTLTAAAQVQGTVKDIGAQVSYLNRASRFNFGATVGHIPLRFGGAFADVGEDPETGLVTRRVTQLVRRIYIDEVSAIGSYPFSQTRRFDVSLGAVRYGFDYDQQQYYIYGTGTRRETSGLPAPDPLYFAKGSVALVGDNSFFGFTSPVEGSRYRFEASPFVGSANYVRLLADYRRYFSARPVTFAVRGLHVGNYGADQDDPFATQYLGSAYYPAFVRGYSFGSIDPTACTPTQRGTCAEADRLTGTRVAFASAEVRLPVLGTEDFGLISFPYLPTELVLFADAGLAWTENEAPVLAFDTNSSDRVPVFSTGIAARFNVVGQLIVETYYAVPFQRPDDSGDFGIRLQPGW